MKNQPFLGKLKKILAYPFNRDFINRQQKAIKLLNDMSKSYYSDLQIQYNEAKAKDCQKLVSLRNDLSKCWDLHDVTLFLSVEIGKVLKYKINMRIFDLKTKWFLWEDIFLRVDLISDPATQESTKRQLNLLREISSIFDLGK